MFIVEIKSKNISKKKVGISKYCCNLVAFLNNSCI